MIGVLLFIFALLLLFIGYPIALTFAGVSLVFGILLEGVELFNFIPYRLFSIMENTILMAIPMFIFMGTLLQKSGLAERLLESMGRLFGSHPGGIALSTILVGAFLAASTGVVGASVVAMGVISLPVMLKYNYDQKLATGVINAAGTLGQIIPPSIILIILGDVMAVPVGDLFKAAMIPGFVLVVFYMIYVFVLTQRNHQLAPPIPKTDEHTASILTEVLKNIIPPLALIGIVLGSILMGIATPTESSSLGCVGAIVLVKLYTGKIKWSIVTESAIESVKTTSMVFAVLIGATAFSMVFTYSGGDAVLEEFFLSLPGEKWTFILLAMLAIFILGFFIDFVEIAFIVVPLLVPAAEILGIDMVWFAILIAMNLQTSFLTPPFGFSLFYLKGVAPSSVKTTTIYKGVIPFIIIQLTLVMLLVLAPQYLGFEGAD